MIQRARVQTCACGNGCQGRASVKWRGYLIVDCVPDEQAHRMVDDIAEAVVEIHRLARRDASDMLRSQAGILRSNATMGNKDDGVRAEHYWAAAYLIDTMGKEWEPS